MNDSKGRAIVIGGTGFIGRPLVRELKSAGYEVIVLSRRPGSGSVGGIRFQSWDGRTSAGWVDQASGALGIINLAGENIASGRWTKRRRKAILESRIWAGEAVTEAVERAMVKPGVVVQASAIGFYGPRREDRLEETSNRGEGFLADVVGIWERSTRAVEDFGVRRVIARSGLVLGLDGGAFPRLLLPFRMFAGGPLGRRRRGFSWIHLKDEIRALRFLLENPDASGAFNLTAPQPVNQGEFTRILGKVLGRPAWLPVPGFTLKAVFGAMAGETLLADQTVIPARLLADGFRFEFPKHHVKKGAGYGQT